MSELTGAGLGLRRSLLDDLLLAPAGAVDFVELAPENWAELGGSAGRRFRALTERYAVAAHGLSLSLGGPDPLDEDWLRRIRRFLDTHGIADYSEHLSWTAAGGQLYELLPLPFTDASVRHVSARIRRTQDLLERRIAVENISRYATLPSSLSEADFLLAVLHESGCDLLLDLNNLYVNEGNHPHREGGSDAIALLDRLQRELPAERIRSYHVAGHLETRDGLRIDTHGEPVIDPVWRLLQAAHARFGVRPTLLERDSRIPPFPELLDEVRHIRELQRSAA